MWHWIACGGLPLVWLSTFLIRFSYLSTEWALSDVHGMRLHNHPNWLSPDSIERGKSAVNLQSKRLAFGKWIAGRVERGRNEELPIDFFALRPPINVLINQQMWPFNYNAHAHHKSTEHLRRSVCAIHVFIMRQLSNSDLSDEKQSTI